LKVYIADDEPEIREALAKVFSVKGFAVGEFSDGQSLLDKVGTAPPDLIILDVMMPKLTGWETCRELKKRKESARIPVIILTAKTGGIDELMAAETGADLYLKKPISPLEIFQQAQTLLGGAS
jgi:DNA-binding response OmpR family regulator